MPLPARIGPSARRAWRSDLQEVEVPRPTRRAAISGRLRRSAAAFAGSLRSPSLAAAQLSFLATWTAEWALTVALGIVAFRAGGIGAVGLVGLARMAPAALLTPLAAPIADRVRRERVLAAIALVRVLALGCCGCVVAIGAPVWPVYVLAMLATAVGTLYRPAHSALLPSLCQTAPDLTSANVVRGLLDSLGTLMGPALAAALLALSGLAAVFFAAAAASLGSAALMLGVHYEAAPRDAPPTTPRVVADAVAGIRAIVARPRLRLLFAMNAVQTFTRGALSVLTIAVAIDLLRAGEAAVGTLTAAVGAGAVIGSLAASVLIGGRHLAGWFGAGTALWGIPIALIAVVPFEPVTLMLLASVGVGNALVDVGFFTLPARLVDDDLLARVFSVAEAAIALTVGLGALITPPLIDALGIPGALIFIGVLCPTATALGWRRLRALDDEMLVRDQKIALLRAVPLLEPLPMPTLEYLAHRLQRVSARASDAVFEQGDPSDRFYLIADGDAEIIGDERLLASLGPGESFGVITLLRGVPRTTTVKARTNLALYALHRHHLLNALTGDTANTSNAGIAAEVLLQPIASHVRRRLAWTLA